MINLFYIEDDLILVNGWKAAFEDKSDDCRIIGSASTICDAVAQITNIPVDIIILDLKLKDRTNPINNLKVLQQHFPNIPIVILTGFQENLMEAILMSKGARAYIIKGVEISEMCFLLHRVLQGERIFSNGAAELMLSRHEMPIDVTGFPDFRETIIQLITGQGGKTGQTDHPLPVQIDHPLERVFLISAGGN